MLPVFIAHSLVEALLEAWPRIWKTDLKRPGLRGFGKNLLERVACCREYEDFCYSILKLICKAIVCGLLFCLSTRSCCWVMFNKGYYTLLRANILHILLFFGFVIGCEAKDRIIGRKRDKFYINKPTVGQFPMKVGIIFLGYILWQYFSVIPEVQHNLKTLEAALNSAPAAA